MAYKAPIDEAKLIEDLRIRQLQSRVSDIGAFIRRTHILADTQDGGKP